MKNKISKLRIPSPDFQTMLLLFLSIGFMVNSMALFYKEHYPWVVLYNPMTNIAQMVKASRDEMAIRDVHLGGFRQAVAIATGSHPYEMDKPGNFRIKKNVMEQMFSPGAEKYVNNTRQKIALYLVYGSTELTFNSEHLKDIVIKPYNSGLYFEAYFNQVIPIGENKRRIRTFHVKGFGFIAPGTIDNPYQIKFTELKIKEILPKKPK